MGKIKLLKASTLETVRIQSDKVDIARKAKEKNGVTIGRFIEDAIYEKAKREKILK